LKGIYEFIDRNSTSFLEEFREAIRKPGVSTVNKGITETVDWLVTNMKENGVKDVQIFKTQRHPIILGRVGKTAKRTLLVYGHYDVQPPGNREDWTVDPFAAEIVDNRIIGRGTCDMKSNLMASIQAVKVLLQVRKSVPINLIFLFEGEEEIGSPNLKPFIEGHKQELSTCDAILCGDGSGENRNGQSLLVYGLKGMLSVELSVKSPTGTETHSMYAGITDNPAWRLISALESLRNDKKVLIPHFYDGVKKPSLAEKREFDISPNNMSKEEFEDAFEIKIKKDMSASEALFEVFFRPTLNINGLCSGYTVEDGIKTIVPDKAWVHIDIRMVPNQDSSTIFENLKAYLLSKGFNDVVVKKTGFNAPFYKVDPHEKIIEVVSDCMKKVVSEKSMVMPIMPGSGALVWLPYILGKPMAFAGSGYIHLAHRPNEFITKNQYLKGIKLFATIYNSFAS
jgi:acetylornithine deacetylase/succinyl-diaminopimelate desuccinylase-like protein